MNVQFCPIASGSNGNCIYVSYGNTKILIDAGLSGKRVEAGLNPISATCHDLDGIFITHEHSDHLSGAGVLSRRYDVPIFAAEATWATIDKHDMIGKVSPKNKRYIYKEENFCMNEICVHPFEIPHDASDPVGYTVMAKDYKVVVATDIGHITDTVRENIEYADILLLESNHDVEMVKTGRYPYPLKKRILGQNGHLSNVSAGKLLCEVISNKLKHVVLGHLSDENNTPMLAYETVFNILETNDMPVNKDFQLKLAKRGEVGSLLEL